MIRLRELREKRNLTQNQLADKLHLSQRAISSYETGVNEPDIETLKKIARFFDVSVDYLIYFKNQNDEEEYDKEYFKYELKDSLKSLDKKQLLNIIEKQIDLIMLIEAD